ncbi:hypothetical protein [Pseudomonas sp. PLMAX]|uniref:hypothetical protein n=1 Tax=Pseudomonas sp. PLMAX TaxID=2201998 RepID=UPI0038BAD99C
MNFLSGELLFHFENFKEPAPTRYVFSTEKRMLILGEVVFDGKTYELKDDELAELETGILPIGAESAGIVVSETIPAWAKSRFISVQIADPGNEKIYKLSDLERAVLNELELPRHQRQGFGPYEVKALIDIIKSMAGAE